MYIIHDDKEIQIQSKICLYNTFFQAFHFLNGTQDQDKIENGM